MIEEGKEVRKEVRPGVEVDTEEKEGGSTLFG